MCELPGLYAVGGSEVCVIPCNALLGGAGYQFVGHIKGLVSVTPLCNLQEGWCISVCDVCQKVDSSVGQKPRVC